MLARALLLLALVASISVGATMYFGQEVLVALGLILVQLKVLAKKLMQVELPAVLAWLKHQAGIFFRVELIKKWMMTTAMPLLMGRAVLRRVEAFVGQYRAAVAARYQAMMDWYGALDTPVKIVALLIVLFATVALSVTSIGLWLILFSVKLPFWMLALLTSTWNMIWVSTQKYAFKIVAFFQLGWLWRVAQGRMPSDYLDMKRRFNFRVARMVVRRRRMTVNQLSDRKDSLSLWWAVMRERWRQSGS
ncbi:MAG: hypothetical protein AAF762_13810 [Pseudomonadota bacterium]